MQEYQSNIAVNTMPCHTTLLFYIVHLNVMSARVNINVSAIDYDKTSKALSQILGLLEARLHSQDEFIMTDSEFAFGWHFFVISINRSMIEKLSEQLGPDFESLKGKGMEKKFLTWLSMQAEKGTPRFKLAIKEEMESSKFGIF